MKKRILLVFAVIWTVTTSVWALSGNVTVTIADFENLPTTYGAHTTSYLFTTNDASGLAGVTLQATNSDVTIGSKYVNADYGNCLSLTTSDTQEHTLTLTAPEGYIIAGYRIGASSNSHEYQHTLTAADGTTTGSIDSYGYVGKFIYLEPGNPSSQTTTFTIQTATGGNTLYIPYFTVTLRKAYVSSIESGKYYRLYNNSYSSLSMSDVGGAVSGKTSDDADYSQVWQLTASDTKYTLKNLFTGKYIQSNPGTSVQYATAEGSYAFNAQTSTDASGNTIFSFQDPSATWYGLHCANTQNYMVVGWNYTDDPSYWKMEEVTVSEDDLAAVDEVRSALSNANSYTSTLLTFFDDYACTTLKSTYASYSDDDLKSAMAAAGLPTALQEMAVRVKNDTWNGEKDETYNAYEKSFRINSYDIWSDCDLWATKTGIGPFAKLFNPTGIQATKGDIVYIYVDDVPSDGDVTLQAEIVTGTAQTGVTKTLQKGCNAIYATEECEIFVSYLLHNVEKSCNDYADIKIHIEGGTCTGYFDMQRGHTDTDWAWLKENMFTGTYLHVRGNAVLLNVITDLVTSETSAVNVMRVWDFIFQTLQKLAGCQQWAEDGRYKMMANCYDNDNDSSNPFWSAYGSSHPIISSDNIFNSSNLRNVGTDGGSIWVITHELAHGHQTPINMAGLTESSNNSLAQCVNFLTATATDASGAIFDTPRSSREDGVNGLISRFNSGYSWIDMGGRRTQTGTYNDVWISNRMYYQLWLYFDYMGKYQPAGGNDGFSFMTALYDALRADAMVHSTDKSNPAAATDDWLKVAKYAAQITQTDLSEFFEVWGMWDLEPSVSNSNDDTENKTWYFEDYSDTYVQTAESYVSSVKSAMQDYETKANNLFFLEDRCTGSTLATYNGAAASTFGDTGFYGSFDTTITGTYSYSIDGTTITMGGDGNGAVGFKIYDNSDNLVAIANTNTFTVSSDIATALAEGTYTLKAAQGDGTDITAVAGYVGYIVMLNGERVVSETVELEEGAPSLPSDMQRDYCTYDYYSDEECTIELNTISSTTTKVYAKCTFAPPFTVSESYASANWSLLKLRGKYAVYESDVEKYPLYTDKHGEAAAQWAFIGDPYSGITVINKAAGEDKTLYADTNPLMSESNTTAWFLAQNGESGFTLRASKDGNNYLNDTSQKGYLGYWNNAAAASDAGSTFVIEALPADYMDQVTSNITPYYNTAGQCFSITEAGKEALEAAGYSSEMTSCTSDLYETFLTIVNNNKKGLTNGFYRIKNAVTPTDRGGNVINYIGLYSTGEANQLQGVKTGSEEADASTIVYLQDSGDNKNFTMQTQGLTVQAYVKDNEPIQATTGANTMTVGSSAAGQAYFKVSTSTDRCLHLANKNFDNTNAKIVTWTASDNNSKWIIEEAETLTTKLNSDGTNAWGTLYVPFSVTLPTGVHAYAIESETDKSVTLTQVDNESVVPAATPVILYKAGQTVTQTITLTEIGQSSATYDDTNLLEGTYTRAAGTGAKNYVLSMIDGVIALYEYTGTYIAPNKAYYPAASGGSVKAFSFGTTVGIRQTGDIHEKNAIYDLSGRRVSKAARGLYIQGGQKMIVK
ncbi:MAG: M60 family metallopeptidase [Bacteroidaceae bacterium]|nr:M60 family metallopeptidase [Bacteroidaceae bacterium]